MFIACPLHWQWSASNLWYGICIRFWHLKYPNITYLHIDPRDPLAHLYDIDDGTWAHIFS